MRRSAAAAAANGFQAVRGRFAGPSRPFRRNGERMLRNGPGLHGRVGMRSPDAAIIPESGMFMNRDSEALEMIRRRFRNGWAIGLRREGTTWMTAPTPYADIFWPNRSWPGLGRDRRADALATPGNALRFVRDQDSKASSLLPSSERIPAAEAWENPDARGGVAYGAQNAPT